MSPMKTTTAPSNLVKAFASFRAQIIERIRRAASRSVHVQEVMTRNPRTCAPDETLHRAAQIMWETDCGCVPVVGSDGRVQAMITDRDVCMAAFTRGRSLAEISVSSAASRTLVTARPQDSLETAEGLMQRHQNPTPSGGRRRRPAARRSVDGRPGSPRSARAPSQGSRCGPHLDDPLGHLPADSSLRRSRRRAVAAAAATSALSFAAFALSAAHQRVSAFDHAARAWAQRAGHPTLDAPMRALAAVGSGYVVALLGAAAYALLLRAGHPLARRLPAAGVGAFLLTVCTKWLVARRRPDGTAGGFPSGHALGATLFFGAVAWLFWTSGLRRGWRCAGALVAILLALGVAYCRLYLDVHWLSDVAGGITGGMACLLLVLLTSGQAPARAPRARRPRRPPAAAQRFPLRFAARPRGTSSPR